MHTYAIMQVYDRQSTLFFVTEVRKPCVEGVAVKATESVAIRVELQNASGQWFAVDDGALLRPDSNALYFVPQWNRN